MKTRLTFPEMRDLPRILEIERACFPRPWTIDDFVKAFRMRNVTGAILQEIEELSPLRELLCFRSGTGPKLKVVAFAIWRTEGETMDVMNFAVDPEHRRLGHGTALIDHLKARLHRGRRRRIEVTINEYSLVGELFLRACGFEWTRTLPRYWDDCDAYVMEYRKRFVPKNRLKFGGLPDASHV